MGRSYFTKDINHSLSEIFMGWIMRLQRMKDQEIPPDFTFKPKSGNADFILGNSPRVDSSDETTAQRWERLSHGDNQRRLCIRQQIAVCAENATFDLPLIIITPPSSRPHLCNRHNFHLHFLSRCLLRLNVTRKSSALLSLLFRIRDRHLRHEMIEEV